MCRSYDSPGTLPTRVIDVGDEHGNQLPYLFIPETVTEAKYCTLSHCWGSSRDCITTEANLETRQAGISPAELPKTFADAIKITRDLGFQYLWIDNLCIVQDSEHDWRSESVRMGSYYRSSWLTIAAADSVDTSSGCFRARNGLKHKPCKIWDAASSGIHGKPTAVYAVSQMPVRDKPSLSTRGWVLQEDLLSPRTLSYGKEGIFWRCVTADSSEWGPHTIRFRPQTVGRSDTKYLQNYKEGLISVDGEGLHHAWLRVIEDFSQRKLTFETDRLVAISGIASEFAKATGDRYLVGLWRRDLWRALMWSVCAAGSPLFGVDNRQYGPLGQRPTTVRGE
jgi:hypothetical protein